MGRENTLHLLHTLSCAAVGMFLSLVFFDVFSFWSCLLPCRCCFLSCVFFSLSCVFFPLSGRPCGIFNWETTLRCWFCKEGPWAIASDQRSLIGEVSMHVFYVVSEPAKVMFYRRCTGARCQPIPSPSAWAETAQGFLALRLAVPPQSAPAQAA